MKGRVKFFDAAKGYGFIRPEQEDMRDVFVHYSEIESKGFKTLEKDAEVAFEVAATEKGMVAKKVVRL